MSECSERRPVDAAVSSVFIDNVVHFGRILRAAGLPVGTGRILEAIRAVRQVGVVERDDFYWTMHAVFVSHPRHRFIFDQAFQIYWKNPQILERSIAALLPEVRVPPAQCPAKEVARRLLESLHPEQRGAEQPDEESAPEIECRALVTISDTERLRQVDFDSMSSEEMEQAKRTVAVLDVAFTDLTTRRFRTHESGTVLDLRKTLRTSLRGSADVISLVRKRRRMQTPPVVLICDISGSMSEYSRMILHFAHTLMANQKKIFCFVFATRLTNITRQLGIRDVDCALAEIAGAVEDWYGGTRIGECLKTFNHAWIRRLPLHRSTVLLLTDGLDRSESVDLDSQMQMLHRSCKELIWLNPLLRYQEFEPRVGGIRAILRYVDAFLPIHNLHSLQALAEILSRSGNATDGELRKNRSFWQRQLADVEPFVPSKAEG